MINDRLGHRAGDRVLLETAQQLTHFLREVDIVTRLGGDESVIILDEFHSLNKGVDCANRIQQALAVPISVEDHDVVINCSIGIVLSDSLEPDADTLLQGAGISVAYA